jgi:two-component system response regulator
MAASTPASPAAQPAANPLILLVEDNPDDEALTLRALARGGIGPERVRIVRDGKEALDYLLRRDAAETSGHREPPAVVLLDLKLPKVDGLEVLRALRNDERTRQQPVVILTSSREEQDIARGYGFGANSYIRKPVDFSEFMEAVGQVGAYWTGLNERPRG